MIRRMLLPLDGSALAESILPCVEEMARLTRATVTVLQVIEPVEAFAGLAGERQDSVKQAVQEADERVAHSHLTAVVQRLSQTGLTAYSRVVIGHPAEMIIRVAASFDLIAMATHGRSGIDRWVHGSVADKVLHGAAVPVLLVRSRPEGAPAAGPLRRILVPLDGSALAEHALLLATDLARRAGAEVHLLQSLYWARMAVSDYPYGFSVSGGDADGSLEEARVAAEDYLGGVAQRLQDAGIPAQTEIRLEPAATSILDSAGDHEIDLIVMSTHGRSGIGRWMLGSVADKVLHGAAIPILLVRAAVPVEAQYPVTAAASAGH